MAEKQLSFFNTIHETGELLDLLRGRALTQQAVVHVYLLERYPVGFTKYEVWEAFGANDKVFHTLSVGRAMTNLTTAGLLEKMDDQVVERFGVKNHLWRARI